MALPIGAFAQAFSESMGHVTATTPIATQEASNGFQNTAFTMSGSGDVRNTNASTTNTATGYATASGDANIFLTNTAGKNFLISGINTTGLTSPALSFGIFKSTNLGDGSEIAVEVSTDGVTFSALTMPAIPSSTASGFAHWYYVTCTGAIPSATNVTIRWTNNHTYTAQPATQWRIDDVMLSGGVPSPTCSANIAVAGALNCGTGTATLTAVPSSTTPGATYLWAPGGATTSAITTAVAGIYNLTITAANGCTSTAQVALNAIPAATVIASASSLSVCPGSTVGLSAKTIAKDLFISEYTEGSGFEKYIEIFNGTGAAVTLTNYVYQAYHNGTVSPTFTVNLGTFQTTLADGAVLAIQNPSASFAIGYTTTAVNHNGNDALAIFNLATNSFADIFGSIGSDPGAGGWTAPSRATINETLRRKASVYAGVTTSPISGFPTLASEWDPFADTDLSGYGSHTMAGDYTWASATTPTAGSPVVGGPITSPTVFTVTANYSASGCSANSTVEVDLYPALSSGTDNDNSPIFLCYGPQCADLTDTPTGVGPFTYLWNTGETTDVITVCNPTATAVYTVVVTDANGCQNAATVVVDVVNACCGEDGHHVSICEDGVTLCVDSSAVASHTAATVGPCASPKAGVVTGISTNSINNSLFRAYPNPFSDNATFEVNVAQTGNVTVEIMDYTGKKVAELNNSTLSAGNYKFNWNGSNAASGLYICRITAGNNVQSVKIQKLSDK